MSPSFHKFVITNCQLLDSNMDRQILDEEFRQFVVITTA